MWCYLITIIKFIQIIFVFANLFDNIYSAMKNFKLILKSLFSNNATVEGARHRPWYFAVIMFFVSMILALVPVFVSNITKKGTDIVKQYNYNMDNLSLRFVEELNEKNVTLEVSYNEATQKNVLLDQGTWSVAFMENVFAFEDKTYNYYFHKDENLVTDFLAFYLEGMTSEGLSNFAKRLEEAHKEGNAQLPSMVLMTHSQIVVYFCNPSRGSIVGSVVGDYESTKVGWDMKELLSQKPHTNAEEFAAYKAETWDNWKNFYNEVYNHNRLTSTWTTTLIMFGINAVLVFFMGLMVFVLTRGKNNPFRIYTFWESMKVGMWAGNMPALLTCGLGFLLTNFMQVLFALLLGVRVMWLTMKTLGPNNVPTPSSNYKEVKTVTAKPSKK